MEKSFAIIDLGSNSVRMAINTLHEDGTWTTEQKLRDTVRLSEGMGVDCLLKDAAMDRVIASLENFCRVAKEQHCASIVAVATAAVRTAVNRDIFLERCRAATGITFDVISGEDEALYSFFAVKESLKLKDGLLFDTGGGSTEITLVRGGQIVHSTSIPCGAVVVTERMAHRTEAQLYRYIASYIGSIHWIDEAQGLPLYGIGGSARTFASLVQKRVLSPEELHGMAIPYHRVAQTYQKLYNTAPELRINLPGMDPSRADVILAGVTPMKVMMDMLGCRNLILCAYGVKEGVFFRLKDEILKKEWTQQNA